MVRFLYAWLIRLHPRWFRARYGEEMRWIFKEEAQRSGAARLLADAAVSVARQWAFRSDFQPEPGAAVAAGRTVDGIPVFYTAEPEVPRPSAMLPGAIVSAAVFALLSFAVAHGGRPPRALGRLEYYSTPMPDNSVLFGGAGRAYAVAGRAPGAAGERPEGGLWAKFEATVAALVMPGKPKAASETAAPAATLETEPLRGVRSAPSRAEIASTPYFLAAPAGRATAAQEAPPTRAATYIDLLAPLSALDSDSDGVLSAVEIAQAGVVLPALDANHDGRLSAEECGAEGDAFATKNVAAVGRARRAYMALHPALAALDANHDGFVSAREMRASAAALSALDGNHDGKLTEDELLPAPLEYGVWLVQSRVDRNFDGRISKRERGRAEAAPWRDLLDASAGGGSTLTVRELRNELRRRADTNHSGVVTWEELRRVFAPRLAATR